MQAEAECWGKQAWTNAAEGPRDENRRDEEEIESLISGRRRKQGLQEEDDRHEGQRGYVNRRMGRPRQHRRPFSSFGASRIHDALAIDFSLEICGTRWRRLGVPRNRKGVRNFPRARISGFSDSGFAVGIAAN